MTRRYHAVNAYDLTWRTVQFALDTMRDFAVRAQQEEGDPEMRGAATELQAALERIENYYLPLALASERRSKSAAVEPDADEEWSRHTMEPPAG